MRAEKVIKQLLNANSAISAIVGSRIWGGVAEEQSPSPLIVYRKLAAERGDTLDREEANEVFAVMEIIVASLDYSQMKELGEAVRLALTYNESINVTIAGVSVLGIKTAGEGEDGYDATRREHFQDWQFEVHHLE